MMAKDDKPDPIDVLFSALDGTGYYAEITVNPTRGRSSIVQIMAPDGCCVADAKGGDDVLTVVNQALAYWKEWDDA